MSMPRPLARALASLAVVGLAASTASGALTTNVGGVYDEQTTQTNAVDTVAVIGSLSDADATVAANAAAALNSYKIAFANAFTAGAGGVIDFDDLGTSNVATTDRTIEAKYGSGFSKTLTLIDQRTNQLEYLYNNTSSSTPISGLGQLGKFRGSGTDAEFDFVLDTGLTQLGFTVLSRQSAARNVFALATLDNGDTIRIPGTGTESIGSTNAADDTFFGFTAPAGRTITRFTVSAGTNFIRLDDIGFVVVPEPASLALLGLGGLLIAGRRRKA